MLNIVLLVSGVLSVFAGVFILLKEERTVITYKDADEIFKIINNFDSKVNSSLKLIDEQTYESLELIQTAKKVHQDSTKQNDKQQWNLIHTSKLATKHVDVYKLYDEGLTSKEIANQLNKGVGEIETIISLFNLERDNNNG